MTKTTSDLLHNPFRNRFNDPVTWRLDEMQAHSNVVWQRTHEKHGSPQALRALDRPEDAGSASTETIFASVFAFVLVLLASAVVLLRF